MGNNTAKLQDEKVMTAPGPSGSVLIVSRTRDADDTRSGKCTFYVSEECLKNSGFKIGDTVEDGPDNVTYRASHDDGQTYFVKFYPLVDSKRAVGDDVTKRLSTDLCTCMSDTTFTWRSQDMIDLAKLGVFTPIVASGVCYLAWVVGPKNIPIKMGWMATKTWDMSLPKYLESIAGKPNEAQIKGTLIQMAKALAHDPLLAKSKGYSFINEGLRRRVNTLGISAFLYMPVVDDLNAVKVKIDANGNPVQLYVTECREVDTPEQETFIKTYFAGMEPPTDADIADRWFQLLSQHVVTSLNK